MKALRILLVEDNAMIGVLLEELLAAMGHDVCATTCTEHEAVTAALKYSPDLMIVDEQLGRGSGISAVEEILRIGRTPACLFVSGDPRKIQARRPDAVVIRKPFREAELVKAIESALQAAALG